MSIEQKKRTILIAVGLFFLSGMSIILASNSFVRYRNDFFARWYATTKLLEEDRNLYDSQNGLEVVTYSNFPDPSWANFYYPAHLLVFTAPLALLPYSVALPVWLFAVQVFYVAGLWIVMDKVNWPTTVGRKTWFMMAAVSFFPYLQNTLWGQFDTIAVLALALIYLALRADFFFLAGILAAGMTFKPQGTGLLLVFLLLWATLRKRRWPFLLGFALTGFAFWAIAEMFQPGWVADFLASLEQYTPTRSVLGRLGNLGQLITFVLILAALALFLKYRSGEANSALFHAELALSFGVWALVVPVVGMRHTVVVPVLIVFLVQALKSVRPNRYRLALYVFGGLYLLGWVGVVIGLMVPGLYGDHITWAELAYKVAAPLFLILFSIPVFVGVDTATARASATG